jgi:hypothetical protein
MLQVALNESVEISVQHRLDIAHLIISPVVLSHLVRLQNIAANLAAPRYLALLAVEFGNRGVSLLLLADI